MKNGRAQVVSVKLGHRNYRTAEVLDGLAEGALIVLHPSDRVKDGIRLAERKTR